MTFFTIWRPLGSQYVPLSSANVALKPQWWIRSWHADVINLVSQWSFGRIIGSLAWRRPLNRRIKEPTLHFKIPSLSTNSKCWKSFLCLYPGMWKQRSAKLSSILFMSWTVFVVMRMREYKLCRSNCFSFWKDVFCCFAAIFCFKFR
jgi:hypothetical protein